MVRYTTAAAAIFMAGSFGAAAWAQTADTVAKANLEWKEIVPGASFAAAYGDWEKGAHGKFVKIARGAEIPMHFHTNDYHAVIVSGQLVNLFDGGQKTETGPGDYFYMAAKRPHSHECLSEEGCIFYTYGDGLWDIEVTQGQ